MSRLFEPLAVGSTPLEHRVVMAPLTRYRCDDDHCPTSMTKEYYEQRASTPGTLIISEATFISESTAGSDNAPGIWSDAQVTAWRSITDAIHAKGCKVFCQLWHQGRAGNPDVLQKKGYPLLSSSAVPADPSMPTPQEMTEDDVQTTIENYVSAARNAIQAGFDGVEIHDRWGGSIENRARFHIEVSKAIIAAIGADKIGMRLSPYSDFLGMLMDDPDPQFHYLVEQLKPLGLAYLHLIEARIRGNDDADCGGQRTVKWIVELWNNTSPVILSGGFKSDSARTAVDEMYKGYDVLIAFGRYFVANPDLVFRLKAGVGLEGYDRTQEFLSRDTAKV
ncbi:NADPH2 dehydrogenase [Fusarium tjaetaba]|uniref:NADPH2 dehydrogenase n=1 Tax=Fusarium tjaetaba TaxID=1567544 RepID=A0A8H5R1I9_9HYPO|nr:NADPH2 dehydrogenase [Fusarium tjaetaba]KAF5627205.1 NADPH2 dehydrogenase [Fusarium tjaetaba]